MRTLARTLLLITLLTVIPAAAQAEKRVALVIGNASYGAQLGALRNPANDARDIAAALKRRGFELVGGGAQLDLDRARMVDRILEFGDRLGPEVVGLFYYAGHGVAIENKNWLVPIGGIARSKREAPARMVGADFIMDQFEETGGGLNIMILDACRNTPSIYRGFRSTSASGLAQVRAPSGLVVSYATQPGNVALDGKDGARNSPYAEELIAAINTPGKSVLSAFNQISLNVKRKTADFQIPWTTSVALEGEFYFAGRTPAPAAPSQTALAAPTPDPKPAPPAPDADTLFWQAIASSDNEASFTAYLDAFPEGKFVNQASTKLATLRQQQVAALVTRPKIEPLDETRVVQAASGLNVRKGPGIRTEILDLVPLGGAVRVSGKVVDRDWFMVALPNGVTGFMSSNFLVRPSDTAPQTTAAPAPAPKPAVQVAARRATLVVNERGPALVRQAPSRGAPKLDMLRVGTSVSVTGEVAGGEWLRVRLADGTAGFVSGAALGEGLAAAPSTRSDAVAWRRGNFDGLPTEKIYSRTPHLTGEQSFALKRYRRTISQGGVYSGVFAIGSSAPGRYGWQVLPGNDASTKQEAYRKAMGRCERYGARCRVLAMDRKLYAVNRTIDDLLD